MKKYSEVINVRKFKTYPTVISLIVTLLTAVAASLFTAMGLPAFNELQKVPIQPPSIVFSVAWSVIYLLTFLSAALYFSAYTPSGEKGKKTDVAAIILYSLMALLNILWVVAVFVFSLPAVGVILILAYILVMIFTALRTFKVSKISAYLLLPHLAWLLFALVLNYWLALIN